MSRKLHSVLGLFETPNELLDAIKKIRPRKLGRLEAYSPYPVHGVAEALELRRTPLPGMVLSMGVLGTLTAFAFQWWIAGTDYPIVTGGKAVTSWQAFVPIMFEVTVLFATFTAGLGMLVLLNRLPFLEHPVLASAAIRSITRDRFALAIEPEGWIADAPALREALIEVGATRVEEVHDLEPAVRVLSFYGTLAVAGLGLLAPVLAGGATWAVVKIFPMMPPTVHMLEQPRLDAFEPSPFFKDGRGIRSPVAGTVARNRMPRLELTEAEAQMMGNPLPRQGRELEMGRFSYANHCLVCHGSLGDGKALLSRAYGAKPASFHPQRLREVPDGILYRIMVVGKNAMPSYARDLSEDERWATAHYIRALQRAQNAEERDF